MSNSERYRLLIQVAGPSGTPDPLTLIRVLNGVDELQGEEYGAYDAELPRGHYQVRLERLGATSQTMIRHVGDTEAELRAPLRFSAVPTTDAATSHEYYTEPAIQYSTTETTGRIGDPDGPEGGLFVFLRASDAGRYDGADLAEGLALVDYEGSKVERFDSDTVETDATGWLAFSARAGAGHYVLQYLGESGRELALAVYGGWQTRLFLTYASRPLFASTSVQIAAAGSQFEPSDRQAQLVDAALAGLQSDRQVLPRADLDELLHGKFWDPMLGLIGAHLLLRSPEYDARFLDVVIDNLTNLIGDAPDVRALRLLQALRHGRRLDPDPWYRPPMLRLGLDAVYEASTREPSLVPEDSPLVAIAPFRLADAPWASWEPRFVRGRPEPETPAWVASAVEEEIRSSAREDLDFDISAVATKYKLPRTTVAGAYEQVREQMPSGSARTLEMERIVAKARKRAATADLTADDVYERFSTGGEGERIEALGLMQGAPELRDARAALDAIAHSRSAFEQYHGIRLAKAMAADLTDDEAGQIVNACRVQRSEKGWIDPGTDRWLLSSFLLEELGERDG